MAEKKYLDFEGLSAYDGKIKALIESKDNAAIQAAKNYADGLADNYEVAGAAASAQAAVEATAATALAAEKNADTAGSLASLIKKAQDQADKGVADAKTADDKAVAAKDAADAVDAKVGTLPAEGDYASVVDMIQKKTAGIATDAALGELTGRVTAAEAKVTTLVGEDANKSVRTIANEELVKQLIPENASQSLNTLEEIAAWIQAHPDDAAAINKKISDLETKVGTLPEGQATVVAYIKSVADAVAAEKSRAEGVESGHNTRLEALEAHFGEGTGTVESQIAAAKTELEGKIEGEADRAKVAEEKNAGDITALGTRVGANETAIKAVQDDLAADGATYVKIDNAAKAAKAAQDDVDALELEVHGADGQGGLKKSVSDNASAIDAAKARISALETKVGDGFARITETEIGGLFPTA